MRFTKLRDELRDELTPAELEAVEAGYAASFAGRAEQLDREMVELKRSILAALPYAIQRLITRFWGR